MLPLKYHTPDTWGETVLKNPLALLSDHAYLERKAASNALELLNRWPEPNLPEMWISSLCSVAKDEAIHLGLVTRLLKKKGGRLQRLHKSQYATDLRSLVRRGLTPEELLDRLLISALIEARSCERFDILARVSEDTDLRRFYGNLRESEKSHYKIFLALAGAIVSKPVLKKRWEEMVEAESRIIQSQPLGPTLHSRHP